MKPIKPKAITRPITKSAETVGGRPENTCAIEYARTAATMMTIPPIVGVPRFVW